MSETQEKILDTSDRVCSICQAVVKGPLAMRTHTKFYHSPINTPLFRGKYPQRQPMASELKDALDKSISIADAARAIGISYLTFRKWCQILIPIEYDQFKKTSRPFSKPRTAVRVNYPYYKKILRILDGSEPPPANWTKTKFQNLLLRDSFFEDKCALCGFEERRMTDYKVPLLLDVIDGVERHWSRDNLRMLCYNCYFLNVRSLYGIEYRNITGQDTKQKNSHDVNQSTQPGE